MRTPILLAVLFALAVPLAVYAGPEAATGIAPPPKVKPGDSVGRFALPWLKTYEKPPFVGIDQWIGARASDKAKVLVLSFWASWCEKCREHELPALKALLQQHKGAGLRVAAVSIDEKAEEIKKALEMADQRGWGDFALLADRRQIVVRRFFAGEQVELPAVLVVDASGIIRYAHTGWSEATHEEMKAKIVELLNK